MDRISISGTVIAQTDKGVKLALDVYNKEEWFPKSQLLDGDDPDDLVVGQEDAFFEIPEWLAEEKGLC